MPIASCKKWTPSIRGMRWSANSRATVSLRTFNCFSISRALSGESLPITRYLAPYCERKSLSIALKTFESSSTLSNIGFGICGFQNHDCRDLPLDTKKLQAPDESGSYSEQKVSRQAANW